MKVTVYFKGPDTSNDMVFTKVSEAMVTEDGHTLNIRHGEPPLGGGRQVLSRIPMANISHWETEQ